MTPYVLTRVALADLQEIHDHIVADNAPAAIRLQGEFVSAMEHLAAYPYAGHPREDLTEEDLRVWPVGNYLVIYRPRSQPLQIIRVVSGFRDLASLGKP